MYRHILVLPAVAVFLFSLIVSPCTLAALRVGVASVVITPEEEIWMSGLVTD